MIGKGGKWLLFLYAALLTVLFLMCSTDLIIREPEREVYQIAVIIEDAKSDNYSNFRKGMERAAVEFNVDVHFITLYEKSDAGQQIELMEREQQDGVDALVVVPAEEGLAGEKPVNVPVVFLQPGVTDNAGGGNIVIDYEQMGRRLAEEMTDKIPADCVVWMVTEPLLQSASDKLFLQGAEVAFDDAGQRTKVITRGEEGGLRTSLESLNADEKVVLLAESPEILTDVSGALSDYPLADEHVCGLYGRGNTMQILNSLDRGNISGICVTDDYSIGYLSVQRAVAMLEGAGTIPVTADIYYIEKENLREPDYEKLLFPIE